MLIPRTFSSSTTTATTAGSFDLHPHQGATKVTTVAEVVSEPHAKMPMDMALLPLRDRPGRPAPSGPEALEATRAFPPHSRTTPHLAIVYIAFLAPIPGLTSGGPEYFVAWWGTHHGGYPLRMNPWTACVVFRPAHEFESSGGAD
jgi:hypothetical protein